MKHAYTTTVRKYDRRRGGWDDVPSIFAGDARVLIATARVRGLVGISRVNKSLTREQVADILAKSIEAVPDSVAIHHLIARNILREFGD